MNGTKNALIFFFISFPLLIYGQDGYFFKAIPFGGEPRLPREYMSTLYIELSGGSTDSSRNGQKEKVDLLSLYGPENLTALASTAPSCSLPTGYGSFYGDLDFFNLNITVAHTLHGGFFAQYVLPVMLYNLRPTGFISEHGKLSVSNTSSTLGCLLNSCDLRVNHIRKKGAADSPLTLGYTHSYTNTEYIDFIDYTLQAGVLFPSGKRKSLHTLFDVAFGYNGHWGFPLIADISWGAFDWLTVGIHAEGTLFLSKDYRVRVKTNTAQEGWIRPDTILAYVHQGSFAQAATYIKADHWLCNNSITIGYSYAHKARNYYRPHDRTISTSMINDDQQLFSWSQHLFHLLIEQDFTQDNQHIGPRVGLVYTQQLTGRRIFRLSTVGAYLGLDIAWFF